MNDFFIEITSFIKTKNEEQERMLRRCKRSELD